ncbi:MAG: prepilin-type N-terminal cleavage/methylation domain-containing protein [Moraxellaceae bacterium]|nr:prepilin-type N-terminal cleavage/methylation domain-containing protein [Moraxellaceae bacterium]
MSPYQLAQNKNNFNKIKGFSLIELMVTIAILAIIVAIAYPSFQQTLYKLEAKRLQNLIKNTINQAKATSYLHRKQVFMCFLDKFGKCNRNGNQQLILFFDKNSNNKFDPSTDSLIQAENLNLKYAKTYFRVSLGRHYSRFSADTGMPRGFYGRIEYCPTTDNNANKYKITFNQLGIIRFKPNNVEKTKCL